LHYLDQSCIFFRLTRNFHTKHTKLRPTLIWALLLPLISVAFIRRLRTIMKSAY